MVKPLLFGVYEQASVGVGGSPGLWTHPLSTRIHNDRLPFWNNLARTLEEGGLDLLFFGDVLGLYDIFRGNHEGAVKWALEAPADDPIIHISALANVTKTLGFGLTASTTYDHPFAFARRMSTLDHLSEGRLGWNVVTSYLDSSAKNFGLNDQLDPAQRYDRADEFMDVAYKLWEGSWADDAVLKDQAGKTYARGDRVRRIDHDGEYFKVQGPHVNAPSPQRTPVIFQAGWSPRGKEFAGKHAEVIFVGKGTPEATRNGLAKIRQNARAWGRNGDEIKALMSMRIIVGKTEADAQRKYDETQSNYHLEAQLVSYAGDTGIDISRYADDEVLATVSKGHASKVERPVDGQKPLTAGDVKARFAKFTRGEETGLIIGTPDQVAEKLGQLAEEAGIDGFLISQPVSPGTVDDFVELVVPALKKRGLFDDKPKQGTLRSRLSLNGKDRLPTEAYGARFRQIV
ncbi:NtaA/DmoA family FMN-dependent monooxygenase [Brucella gallinifaecis]|uniref:NtaA/DmoA family FMN-dependent monooxygenase n=1 Tax=Brucella gallinifaecis TaxID=215590 RepID=UPI00235ED80A|nr:NtaA/DmoA family FMN-dependent monooxygenase [Brucella gallinifaecis]